MLGPALSQLLADLNGRKEQLTPFEKALHVELSRADRMAPEFAKVLKFHLDDNLGPIEFLVTRSDAEKALSGWQLSPSRKSGRRHRSKMIGEGGAWPRQDPDDMGSAETAIEGGGSYPEPKPSGGDAE